MSTTVAQFITFHCDNPKCDKTVTYAHNQEAMEEAKKEYPWLNSLRFVVLPDKREFGYCSDTCEIESVGTGTHNPLAAKSQIVQGNDQQIALAARAAEQARKAQEALRNGTGIQVQAA